MATEPIFEITDGTTTISFLARHEGFFHFEWEPSIAEYKDDGIFSDNPITEGRVLVSGIYGNAQEDIILRARANSADLLSEMISDLRKMVARANAYWIYGLDTDNPIYLKVRGRGETNTRYAVVRYARVSGDPNPFSQPFIQADDSAVATEIELLVERGHWQNFPPGQDGDMPSTVRVQSVYLTGGAGPAIGNADLNGNRSTAYDAFFSNKYNNTNIGNAYYHPSGGSVEANNRQNDPLTITYIPSTGVGSVLYLGSDLPFNSVIVPQDGTAGTGAVTLEYWNGSSWATPTQLNTLDAGGGTTLTLDATSEAKGFRWSQPSGWTTDNLQTASGDGGAPSVIAFWVRLRVTSSITTGGIVCNERIYTVNWPFVDIMSSEIPGNDLSALLRQVITPYYRDNSAGLKMMFSVIDKDAAMEQPFINFSGLTLANRTDTIVAGTDTTISATFSASNDASRVAGGRIALLSPSGTTSTWTDRVTARVVQTGRVGRFRMFARIALEDSSDDPTREHLFRINVTTFPDGRDVFTSKPVKASDDANYVRTGEVLIESALLDFGVVDTTLVRGTPQEPFSSADAQYDPLDITIQSKNPNTAITNVAFIDLIMMPVNMAGVELSGFIVGHDDYVIIDCSRDPRNQLKAYMLDTTALDISKPQLVAQGVDSIRLDPYRDYRIVFFLMARVGSIGLEPYYGDDVYRHQSYGVGRYLSLRGES